MVRRWLFYLLVAPFLVACGVGASDFVVEGVDVVGDVESDEVKVELTLRNDSQRDITINQAQITVQIKGEDLVSFLLNEKISVLASNTTTTQSSWSVRRDDPTTLYAMRRHPIERYLDRLTFSYEVSVEGVTRRERRFRHRGLKAEDLDINFEKLLR